MQLNLDPTALRDAYANAAPFPHAALDGLFADDLLEQILAAFPSPRDLDWASFNSPQEKKLGLKPGRDQDVPTVLRSFLWNMSAPPMLDFLEKLTGIEGLIPDPYFGGGGLHQIESGGFLKIHADFNWHPKLKLDRRLNVLVYLNHDWPEEYGGHLELWDRQMTRCVRRILPVFNRTVVFTTTDDSYHGHPLPLACPPERTRKSASFYYYTAGRPESERSAAHDTVFKERPGGEA
jgi:2OG-Fe(II) oxygenase superfamily